MRLPTAIEGVLLAVVVIAAGFFLWNFDPFGRRERAEQKAATATAQAENNDQAVRQVDRYVEKTTIVREKAQEAEDAVRQAPGAETPLDPDRRDVLCGALASLRGSDACTEGSGS